MSASSPEEPLDIRAKSITPQSPKPIRLTSSAILNEPMDSSIDAPNTEIPEALPNKVPSESHITSEAIGEKVVETTTENQDETVGAEPEDTGSSHLVQSSAINQVSTTEPTAHVNESEPLPSINPPITTLPTGGVDFQKLLNSLAPQLQSTPTQAPTTEINAPPPNLITLPVNSSLPSNSSLPPRPQVPNPINIEAASYIPILQPNVASAINGMPSPHGSYQQPPLSATSITSQSLPKHPFGSEDDTPFPPELEGPYQDFLDEESKNVADAKWDRFPDGSRLFIGNLSTEKITKRDVFRRFSKYGNLAQISLKQAYGFVQFLDSSSCGHAKEIEQDAPLKGRKMHLEISRPQNKGTKDRSGRRRSRSPRNDRGDRGDRGDRYGGSHRDRDRRGRDDYRPGRSPSPRRRRRSPDLYDGRTRSRSPSPYRRQNRREDNDDLPLPQRHPRDVPEVQIIVLDDIDRNFIKHIENALRDRGIRTDVLIPSSRLPEQALIRRQILEGVLAVLRLTRVNQVTGLVPLQIFDRRAGAQNVKFEGELSHQLMQRNLQFVEYADLNPTIAAELVLRARLTHNAQPYASPQPNSYGLPQSYGAPQLPGQVDYSSLIAQFGSRPDLQAALAGAQQQAVQGPNSTTNLNQLLAAATGQQGYPINGIQAPPMNYAAPPSMVPSTTQQSGGQPNLQELMAQLSRYQK
jgi:hypothetical protein